MVKGIDDVIVFKQNNEGKVLIDLIIIKVQMLIKENYLYLKRINIVLGFVINEVVFHYWILIIDCEIVMAVQQKQVVFQLNLFVRKIVFRGVQDYQAVKKNLIEISHEVAENLTYVIREDVKNLIHPI